MKNIFWFLAVALFLVACSNDGYKIKGTFATAEDGVVIYMLRFDEDYSVADSAVVQNGKFEFSGGYHERSVRMLLAENRAIAGPVVLEPGVIEVDFSTEMSRAGTEGNEILQRFISASEHLKALEHVTSPAYASQMGMGESMLDSLVAERESATANLKKFSVLAIGNNIDNGLGFYILSRTYKMIDVLALAEIMEGVPAYFRDARYNTINDYLEYRVSIALKQKELGVGGKFQNFELNSLAGDKVLFSNIVEGADITLLQFWASWCAPCRAEIPELQKVCAKYNKKGLKTVYLSLDGDIEECRDAVKTLGISGLVLCNPGGGSSEVATAYGVDAIPSNVLVNRKGMIVARNVSPKELDALLKKILE